MDFLTQRRSPTSAPWLSVDAPAPAESARSLSAESDVSNCRPAANRWLRSTVRIPPVLIIIVSLGCPRIMPKQLVGQHQTRQQNRTRNYTSDDATRVLKRLSLWMRLDFEHGHLL